MAHQQQRDFIQTVKGRFPQFFDNVEVFEIGSLNINGTVRDFFTNVKKFTGFDLIEGKDVDVICEGHKIIKDPERVIDTVISTECFEHDQHWIETFKNMHNLARVGGLVIFTCASDGRREHGTTRTSPADSPATNDYYANLGMRHFVANFELNALFIKYGFEYNAETCDLYFWGIKK